MEKVVKIVKLGELNDDQDIDFWLSKTPKERLAAVTKLLYDYCFFHHISTDISKVGHIGRLSENYGDSQRI